MSSLAILPTQIAATSDTPLITTTIKKDKVIEPASVCNTVVDTVGSSVDGLEYIIDATGEFVGAGATGVTHLLTGLTLPKTPAHIVDSVVDTTINTITDIGSSVAIAGLNGVTFGAPAWAQAARRYLAVNGGASELNLGYESNEFLARSFALSEAPPIIKDALLEYLQARHELKEITNNKPTDTDNKTVETIARKVAALEVRLGRYSEFRDLKEILQNGAQFVIANAEMVDRLAIQTADRIIKGVEDYYLHHGALTGNRVLASSLASGTDEEKHTAKEALKNSIATRLRSVFERELNCQETQSELGKVSRDLMLSFEVYRAGLRAGLFTVLGVANATGVLQEAFKGALDQVSNWTYDGAHWMWDKTGGVITNAIDSAKAFADGQLEAFSNYLYQKFEPFLNRFDGVLNLYHDLANSSHSIKEGVENLASHVTDNVHEGAKSIADKLPISPLTSSPKEQIVTVLKNSVPDQVLAPLKQLPVPTITPAEITLPELPIPQIKNPLPKLVDHAASRVNDSLISKVPPIQAGGENSLLGNAVNMITAPISGAQEIGSQIARPLFQIKETLGGIRNLFGMRY